MNLNSYSISSLLFFPCPDTDAAQERFGTAAKGDEREHLPMDYGCVLLVDGMSHREYYTENPIKMRNASAW